MAEKEEKKSKKDKKKNDVIVKNTIDLNPKLKEEAEEDISEAPLNMQQRRARAMAFRRAKSKVLRGRKIAQRKMASPEKLKTRARKKAIELIRKKVAGDKGADYANLSPAEKQAIDKRVQAKKGAIGKTASRLLPKVKQAERERLRKFKSSGKNESLDSSFENYLFECFIEEGLKNPSQPNNNYKRFHELLDKNNRTKHDKRFRFNRKVRIDEREDKDIGDREGSQPAQYHTGLSKSTKEKRDRQFKKGAQKDSGDPSAYPEKHAGDDVETKTSKHTLKYRKMYGEEKELFEDIDKMLVDIENELFEEVILEKSLAGLKKKAEKSGIPYGILKKVYDRGMAAWRTGHRPGASQEQWAYARVNSFITKGKGTWGKADADLAAKVRKEQAEIQEKFSQSDVDGLEKFADRILKKYDIDVEFTRHFVDRLNDPRNDPEIKVSELQRFFKKIQKNKGKNIRSNPDVEVVLKDLTSNINLPVVISHEDGEFKVVNKTVMRKSNFKTPNKVIKYEAKDDSLKESEAQDKAKEKIKQEKERDKVKHDRMMDRARLADTRKQNRGIGEEIDHDKCGTPDCCGQCDTATQNLDEAFTAMISDTMFANEFPELHAKGGFALHPSVEEVEDDD